MGYRYYQDNGPVIYWTNDQGETWQKLSVSLPKKFDGYKKNPLSPIFNRSEGLYPIALFNPDTGETGMIYLHSKDGGLTWEYDEAYDKLGN